MFHDRFEGSLKPPGSRVNLTFAAQLMPLGRLKDDWGFIATEPLRSNIAAELQKVHFDVLLMNNYNVYYSPEALTMKHAVVAVASVAEAVLEIAVRMIETDPRVEPIIQARERVFDELHTLQLREFEQPDGTRVVTGVQREVVRSRLDRHTKMDLLIRAARAGEVIGDEMAERLRKLQRLRNRIHIKSVEELEYASYTHTLANAALNLLEEFRQVMKPWIEARQQRQSLADALVPRAAPSSALVDLPTDPLDFGPPLVTSPPYSEPPLVTGPPGPEIPDFGPADDDIPF